MKHFALRALIAWGITLIALLAMAGLLHLIPKLGRAGARLSERLCRAPGLDVIITYFTVLPLGIGAIAAGWAGLLGAAIGQTSAVLLWVTLHEWAHRDAVRGPRIVKVLNRLVGRWRNHAALWWMALAAPMFWLVRIVEIIFYPPLCWLVGLPKYNAGDWVNVSRQKFAGLVGHDLIWCLYCDWMTSLWSLGSEMLRNIESFWCPIRFANGKKCVNCRLDFPDVENGWVEATGSMGQVAHALQQAHGDGIHAWFGHPVRITVRGKAPELSHSA